MSGVYLNRIRLEQYRTFKSLDIRLPDGPGVLVVHGSNGIGKSSMFDGLEWALTDKIDHFRDADGVKKVGSYLCRWRDNAPGPTSVTMEFSGENVISRTLSSSRASKSIVDGNIPDITAFLSDESWDRNISELSSYLLLTHFLGQSTKSRLTNRDPGERFDILKEAAQSKEIEEIAKALHGKGNTKASIAYSERIRVLNREVEELQSLLDAEASLWAGLTSVGALNDDGATQLAQIISQLLDEAAGNRKPVLIVEFDDRTISTLDGRLTELRDRLRTLEANLISGNETLTAIEGLSRRFSELKAAEVAIDEQVASLTARRHDLQVTLDNAKTGEEAARVAAKNARDFHTLVTALKDAIDAVTLLTSNNETTEVAVANARARLDVEAKRLTSLERRLQIVRRIEGDVGRLDEHIKLAQSERENVLAWLTRDARVAELRSIMETLEASAPNLDDDIERQEGELRASVELLKQQEQILGELRKTVTAVSSAVASVAANLPQDACDCPVCATHFEVEGELQRRAAGAAERLAPLVLAQEALVIKFTQQRDAAHSMLEQLRALDRQRAVLRNDCLLEEHTNKALSVSLFGGDSVERAVAQDRCDRLAETAEDLARLRQRKWYWRNLLSGTFFAPGGDHAAAVRLRDQAQAELNIAIRNQESALKAVEAAKLSVAEIDEVFGANPPRSAELDEAIRLAQADLLTKEAASVAAISSRETLEEDLASIDVASTAATVRKQQNADQVDAATQNLNRAMEAWGKLNLPGSSKPDAAELRNLSADAAAARAKLSSAEDLMKQLRDGRTAKTLVENHVTALERLRLAVSGAPNSDRLQLRAEANATIDEKARLAGATQEAKEIAQAASTEILDELAEFNASYMQPLDDLMNSISRTILCDPRVGIDHHVRNRRVEQSARKEGEVPAGIGLIDPVLVHSEGQMAALSVSMLCAASLTYPWSRWRALVLDDPLQHNDAIHSAAFADFVCNLVAERGYQVLLSTHDRAQAEFLRRKVASRNLPCSVLSLLGVGQEGVEWNYRPAGEAMPAVAASG